MVIATPPDPTDAKAIANSIAANGFAWIGGTKDPFPDGHEAYLAKRHAAGQTRPTPLQLRYGAGDYNRLHQDVYGALAFPFQATIMLANPDKDFIGGEFVLVEQRPRAQTRAAVIALRQGEAVLFLSPAASSRAIEASSAP